MSKRWIVVMLRQAFGRPDCLSMKEIEAIIARSLMNLLSKPAHPHPHRRSGCRRAHRPGPAYAGRTADSRQRPTRPAPFLLRRAPQRHQHALMKQWTQHAFEFTPGADVKVRRHAAFSLRPRRRARSGWRICASWTLKPETMCFRRAVCHHGEKFNEVWNCGRRERRTRSVGRR